MCCLTSLHCKCGFPVGIIDWIDSANSKCGKEMEQIKEQLGGMAACVRTFRLVEPTLQSEISWPKHHEEYLEHIITK